MRAGGIAAAGRHSTGHPSPFQTCPLLSDWIQVSSVTWTEWTFLKDSLCKKKGRKKKKAIINIVSSYGCDEGKLDRAFIQLTLDLPFSSFFLSFFSVSSSSSELYKVVGPSVILPASPLKNGNKPH